MAWSSKRGWRLILFIGFLFGLSITFDWWPLLRGPQAWRWAVGPPLTFNQILVTGGSVGLFIGGWWYLREWHTAVSSRARPVIALLILSGLTLLIQLSFLMVFHPNPLALQFERLASDQASGYFTVAQEIDHLPTFLRQFPQRMPHFRPDPHPRTKPPGIILLYWGLEQLLARWPTAAAALGHWGRGVRCLDLWLVAQSDAGLGSNVMMAVLIPLLSTLAIWPAYGWGKQNAGAAGGWLAAGLIALMPARLAFTPHMDTVYPLLTLTALYLADTGLKRQQPLWGLLAGLILSIATFFSLVNALAALLVGFYVLFTCLSWRAYRPFIKHGVVLVAGTLSLWLLYWLTSRVTPFAIYAASATSRHDLARSYGLWLAANLYDVAIFAGVPVFLLAILAYRQRLSPLWLAFWLVLVGVNLSGAIRGEVGRIWLMLLPIPALLVSQQPEQEADTRWQTAVLLVTALSTWAIGTRWQVTQVEWSPTPPRSPVTTAPDMAHLLTADFGPNIQLRGYEYSQDDALSLTLQWHALARPDIPYTIFIHLTDPATSEIVTQRDVMPQDGRLPTTCWQPGEYIQDSHTLTPPPGTYNLTIGLYDQTTGTRPAAPLSLPPITIAP